MIRGNKSGEQERKIKVSHSGLDIFALRAPTKACDASGKIVRLEESMKDLMPVFLYQVGLDQEFYCYPNSSRPWRRLCPAGAFLSAGDCIPVQRNGVTSHMPQMSTVWISKGDPEG